MSLFNGQGLQYLGTSEFRSPPPSLKLDFCNEKRDTAHFYGFQPEGGESWILKGKQFPVAAVLPLYTACFPDIAQYQQNVRNPLAVITAAPYSFLFNESLVNKQKVVFDHTLDGKKIALDATNIRYAVYRVRIEHVE